MVENFPAKIGRDFLSHFPCETNRFCGKLSMDSPTFKLDPSDLLFGNVKPVLGVLFSPAVARLRLPSSNLPTTWGLDHGLIFQVSSRDKESPQLHPLAFSLVGMVLDKAAKLPRCPTCPSLSCTRTRPEPDRIIHFRDQIPELIMISGDAGRIYCRTFVCDRMHLPVIRREPNPASDENG